MFGGMGKLLQDFPRGVAYHTSRLTAKESYRCTTYKL